VDAGADHVASTLVESRNYFGGLLEKPRIPAPPTIEADEDVVTYARTA
jgi:hypothetical protein